MKRTEREFKLLIPTPETQHKPYELQEFEESLITIEMVHSNMLFFRDRNTSLELPTTIVVIDGHQYQLLISYHAFSKLRNRLLERYDAGVLNLILPAAHAN